jgi:hypothetical protein
LSDLSKSDGSDRQAKEQACGVEYICEHQMTFDRLKEAVTSAPVLIRPGETKPYAIETDAADFGYGMALYQEGTEGKLHPVAFDGKSYKGQS